MKDYNSIELKDVCLAFEYESKNTDRKSLFNKHSTTKNYNKVLNNISLEVKKGEILGIVGTNGAGKSTLLSVMSKILEPDSGTVEISGKIATILELGMGFHNDLSGRENIILKGELYGFSKKEMESKVETIIDYSGIRNYIDNPIRTYSSGMKSRLAFSIMINVNADILLVDEILSTGDLAFSAKAADFFKKILKDGKTVVFVSHSSGSIESICTRVIWLKDGKIIADGKPKKICSQYKQAVLDSIEVITDQAQSGLAESQYRLALMYKEGLDVEQNSELYEHWLGLASEQGHIKAQVEYADLLLKKDPNNLDIALQLYESSAARGDLIARLKLSEMKSHNTYRGDYLELKQLFATLAKSGHPTDVFRYANFLFKTAWDKSDRINAFELYKKVAEEFNHPDALMQLAVMYRDGIGVKKNKKQYIEILKKADSLNVIKATQLLAEAYETGVLVEENAHLAFEYYLKCAKQGVINCQYIVGAWYHEGIGTEIDETLSKYWFGMYSRSTLLPYQLTAISIIKSNNIENAPPLEELYTKIKDSKNEKAIGEYCNHLNEEVDTKDNRTILEQYYEDLSQFSGKSLIALFKYYSNPMSFAYNIEKSRELAYRVAYTGDLDILYKSYCVCKNAPNNTLAEFARRCLIVAARKGHVKSIRECIKLNIIYEELS